MPRLELFGRRWGIGSDDFVVSPSFDIIVRISGFIFLFGEFAMYHHEMECDWGHLIRAYLIGLMVLFLLTIPLDILIVRTSMRGTILDSEPRQRLPSLIYARVVLVILEWVWTIFGTEWAFQRSQDCVARTAWVAALAVTAGWVSLVLEVIGVIIVFDFNNKGSHQAVITKQDWEKRWRWLFCGLGGANDNKVYSQLANLCTDLFKEIDLVPTDIFAGLILLHKQQKVKRQAGKATRMDMPGRVSEQQPPPGGSGHPTPTITEGPSPEASTPLPWMTLGLMTRYMEFAFGSYGWVYFIGLNNPVIASYKLLTHTKCFSCTSRHGQIHKDNRCLCHTTAFRITTGLHLDDIVHASHHNEIYAIPFYVSIDRSTRSVVVSIRGTLSLEDVITDLGVERTPLDIPGVEEAYAHYGMLQSAQYIRKCLADDKLLEQAFAKAEGAQLVVTGHSLGAGVAALLAILLKPTYPDVICFAYAPPGELISENAVAYTQGFICSVALGLDVVPRLGVLEMRGLKINVLKAICNCRLPKHEVLAGGLWKRLFGKRIDDHLESCVEEEVLLSTGEGHQTPFQRYLQEVIREEMSMRDSSLAHYHPLVPPGQILHVLETSASTRRNAEYYAVWTDQSPFREIVLSSKMIAHHFPDTLLEALRQLRDLETPDSKKTS